MTETRRATGLRLVFLIGVVAMAYYASGRLGLLLAIPPGYATAVWPASGIALAAVMLGGGRLAVGVALGSFLVNVATSFDAAEPVSSTMVSVTIAFGAAAQAMLGALLIERYVGYRNVLTQDLAAVRMIALGGPVACVLNAVVGAGTLWLNGQIPAPALWLTFGTWWIGDTIGVLIFAPLVLVWAVRPYREWIWRQLFVTVPLMGLFAAVVAMFVFISRHEQARLMTDFERTARVLAREVRKDLGATVNSLNALEGLYASSENVDGAEFDTFASRLLGATPAIQALSWAPRVSATEQELAAGAHPFRVPVRYIAPAGPNTGIVGFDNASEPTRLAALEAARDSGLAAATPPIEFVQGGAGILLYVPVFRGGARPDSVEARRDQLDGFVVAALGLDRFMRTTTNASARAGIAVRLTDAGPAGTGGVPADSPPEVMPAGGFRQQVQLHFGGRELRLVFELPGQALLAQRRWETWAVLAGGLALTSIVGIMLLLGVGREAHAEALVRERTASLRASEEALRREATHDHLTGLPNRLLFLDRLEQAIEHGRRNHATFALLYLDIDGFKPVNDLHGHAAGDELLRQLARELREAVRGTDTAARLGGDEFALILSAPQEARTAMAKAADVVALIGATRLLALTGRPAVEARVGASVGVALYPDHGATVDALIHAADTAMYEAKRAGKNSSRLAG